MATNRLNVKYIYDLPYSERTELCHILDQNNKWEELGGKYMQFTVREIQEFRREFFRHNSPTDELLTKWGHSNHTVTELFVLLSRMHHYQAMRILKPFVDPQCHRLLNEGEENMSQLFNSASVDASRWNDKDNQRPMGTSNTKPVWGADGAAAIAVAGPSQHKSNPLLQKEMDFGQHNLNTSKVNADLLLVNKVALPPEPVDEKKIINVAENNENSGLEANMNVPPRKLSNVSDASSMAESCGNIPDIPYKELVAATQGWDKQTILGKGGFGTVFKGTWKNTQVAIKRIEQRGAESAESYQGQMEQSLRELRILNSCRHDNILPVYGFSIGGGEPCLVYQFMPNGSLEDRILCRKGSRPLTWQQRHNIAEGTARGLQFLHNHQKPFIHGDIKSANILLDANMEARIGDFGLAREGPHTQYTHMTVSRVHGTRPYLPDEFLRSKKLSTKVDTFSYGIVLFELSTGLRAYDENRPKKFLKEFVENCEEKQRSTLSDKKAGFDDQNTYLYLILLGIRCVSKLAKDRPDMEVVLKQLEVITAKRDMVVRAQDVMRQNSPSPSTPYEMQVFHDRLSQMRQVQSPAISRQPPPNEPFGTGTGEPNIQPMNVQNQNNPFLFYTPPQEHDFKNHQAPNPGLFMNIPSGGFVNGNPMAYNSKVRLSPLVPSPTPVVGISMPVISLTPASSSDQGSTYTSDSEHTSQPDTIIEPLPPALPQEMGESYDNLPMLSVLGITDGDKTMVSSTSPQTVDEVTSSSLSSMSTSQPTAQGKAFLFPMD